MVNQKPLVMPPALASPEVAWEDMHEGERRYQPVNTLISVELQVKLAASTPHEPLAPNLFANLWFGRSNFFESFMCIKNP